MMDKYKGRSAGDGDASVAAVADENGVLRPKIDPLRCGVLVCDRPASGAIATGTGVTTGHTVAKGKKLIITEWEICSAVGANHSFSLYNDDGAGGIGATRYGGIAVPTGGVCNVKSAILIDAVAAAVTVWLDAGTTGDDPDLCIYGVEWTEKTI